MKRLLLSTAAVLMASPVFAQLQDAPAVDLRILLEGLKQLKEQNEAGVKGRLSAAYQQVSAAASSPERAVAFWKEAVRAVQFEGAEKEGAQIRDWREGDGEALSDRLCANAVRLHLNWLAINLQHAAGAETKTLLPKVLDHVAGAQAAQLAAEQLAENLVKAKDRSSPSPGAKKNLQEDSVVKRVHDQVMRLSIAAGPVARWLQLGEMFGEARRKSKETGVASWELVAGNVDGIYDSVILPEYRATKDPRLLEYWDMVLKRETDRARDRKLDVEQRDWNQVKRPAILWNRAQDVLLLGQRNKAIMEMYNVIKSHPQHPDAGKWIGQLESMLLPTPSTPTPAPDPTAPTPASAPSAAAAPAPSIAPPTPVPSPVAAPTASGGGVPVRPVIR